MRRCPRVHNVVLNIDGGVYAHGKSECIAWARIDCVLFAILIENDDVGEENRGFHVGNLNASDFGAKLFNGIDGESCVIGRPGFFPSIPWLSAAARRTQSGWRGREEGLRLTLRFRARVGR